MGRPLFKACGDMASQYHPVSIFIIPNPCFISWLQHANAFSGWFEFATNMLMARREPCVSGAGNRFVFIRTSAKSAGGLHRAHPLTCTWETLSNGTDAAIKKRFTCKSPGPRWSALPCWPSSPLCVAFDTCGTLEWRHVTLLPGHMSTYSASQQPGQRWGAACPLRADQRGGGGLARSASHLSPKQTRQRRWWWSMSWRGARHS